jgi:hypothetical protein
MFLSDTFIISRFSIIIARLYYPLSIIIARPVGCKYDRR